MRWLGIRARLAASLVAVAVTAVALAALIGNLGLGPRLSQAARARLADEASHLASVAAAVYEGSGTWDAEARAELAHLAALDGLRVELEVPGQPAHRSVPVPATASALAKVRVHHDVVATVVVWDTSGRLLSAQDKQLRGSLDRLHLLAAAVAALVALVVALLLAGSLSKPLRRIRAVAERLGRGEMAARVGPVAEPEARAVGRALNRLAETLAREEELRKESVADLAHELRTPVNGLLARIEAAQDGLLPTDGNLSAMHAEAVRLTRLLDDLTRLADAERPGLLVEMVALDLAGVAASVATAFEPRFAAAGIAFRRQYCPAWVVGDSRRLEQVVANLLANALAYTEQGGQVALGVGVEAAGAYVEVSDTGVGIASEDLRHIYTRFWRADRSRSRATGGSGIGLAIVRELVRAHQGRIEVESAPGRGSRFRVVLPALRAPQRRHAGAA